MNYLSDVKDIVKHLYLIKCKNRLKTLPLHEPFLDKNDLKSIIDTVETGYVSSAGKEITKFENLISKKFNFKHVIAVNSGTSAIHLSLLALGISKNDEILVPSLTFVGTVNPIRYCDAIPNFIDISLKNLCVCPNKLENYLKQNFFLDKNKKLVNKTTGNKVKAIIYVNIYGNIGEIMRVKEISKKYHLKLIEDSAESLGSSINGRYAGSFGDLGIFSFNGNKIITTGMGGAIITNNSILAKKVRKLSSTSKKNVPFEFIHTEVAFNYRMSNLNASLGISQLNKLDNILKYKKKLNKYYVQLFDNYDFEILEMEKESNFWMNAIYFKENNKNKINQIMKLAAKKNIFLRPLWKPIHLMNSYKGFPADKLINTIKAYNRVLCLPSSAFLKC